MSDPENEQPTTEPPTKAATGKGKSKARTNKADPQGKKRQKRSAIQRPYPVVPYREATVIGDAIFKFAAGGKVRRLTLLEKLERNPNSSATRMLITNSGKYGITVGSYAAEFLELTESGRTACNPEYDRRTRLDAQFKLAVTGVAPFKVLYDTYVSKRLPAHEVMKDRLLDSDVEVDNPKECIDLFVVNIKDLGLLRTIAGAETLVPIEQSLEEAGVESDPAIRSAPAGSQVVEV